MGKYLQCLIRFPYKDRRNISGKKNMPLKDETLYWVYENVATLFRT